jgi:urea transport system substrate-binding protein
MNACPSHEQLEQFRNGRLSDFDRSAVHAHVQTCAVCQQTVFTLVGSGEPGTTVWNRLPTDAAQAQEAAALPAELLNHPRYHVLELLDVGGMGAVFKAEHRLLERTVVLKVIRQDILNKPEQVQRFLREAKLAAALTHPNIVTLYEAEQVGASYFLVMEYLAGTDLFRLVKERGPLPVDEACEWARQAAVGLQYIQERGLVHRDIKPSNLFLVGQRQVKILDLGLAVLRTEAKTTSGLTEKGQILGTLDYMAPEQWEDSRAVDIRADIYSLGCTLYHLLAGKPPFGSEEYPSMMKQMWAHAQLPVPPLREHRPEVPLPLVGVLDRMLAKKPAERFGTPAEAAAALEPHAAVVPGHESSVIRSRPPSPTIAAPPPGKRSYRRFAFGAGLAALLLVAGILAAFFWRGFGGSGDSGGFSASAGRSPLKVGILHSRTGTMAISEKPVIDATLFAIEEVNAKGGIRGRQVEAIVEDGASDWPTFARKAEKLITQDQVCTLFGCWTSASRKTVKPVVEKYNHLLFYPVQYEGLEQSPNIVYTGACPNQQIIPALKWCCSFLKKKRLFLAGSDYIFPRAANAIIRDQAADLGADIVGEEYLPLGGSDMGALLKQIQTRNPDLIVNTINGDSNVAFFRALRRAGITSDKVPTISFSVSEEELSSLSARDVQGDYAAWSYFQSIEEPENQNFLSRFRARFGAERHVSDPMEAAYIAVHLWAQAVKSAQGEDVHAIRQALRAQSFEAPEGRVRLDPQTHHLSKLMRIGRVRENGRFAVVYRSDDPIKAIPYPATRSKAEWDALLTDLHLLWGGQWANPDAARTIAATGRSNQEGQRTELTKPVNAPPRPLAIAVVPFALPAGEKESEYLRDGIAGALAKKLLGIEQLAVRPYIAAPQNPAGPLDLREIGRRLDAQAVLTGRIHQSPDQLSIHVELVNVRDNRVVWIEEYERRPAELQDIETEIAKQVCTRLGVSFGPQEEKRLTRRDTADAEAYRLYLQGRYYLAHSTLEGMKQSLACFKQAIARDRNYALAYAGIADTYGYYAGDWLPYEEALPQQKAAARKAMELDDELAEAHLAMGSVYMGQDYDWPAAELQFKRAIELKPNLDLAHDAYAQLLAFQGRFEESIAQQKQALAVNPNSPSLMVNLSYLLFLERRYDQAMEQSRKALAIDPNFVVAHDYLAAAYLQKGQFTEAITEFRRCRQLDDVPWYLARLASAQAFAGNQSEARTLLKELQELSKRRYVTPECFFLVYVGLDDRDAAFTWLERMYKVRSQYPLRLKVQPEFDKLRADPRFGEWLRQLKLAP